MFSENQVVLILAAHPDDEVLGCGGTIAKLKQMNCIVHTIFLADGETSRLDANDVNISSRKQSAINAAEVLGTEKPIFINYPDNQLDSIPRLKIIQQVESFTNKINPNLIITHHGGDLNIDHRITHEVALTISRPTPWSKTSSVICFEIPSSTDWSSYQSTQFSPQLFVDISKFTTQKNNALKCYGEELRDFPHSRSVKSLEALSVVRGAQSGLNCAEAFMIVRHINR